jgi:hypothetical protein
VSSFREFRVGLGPGVVGFLPGFECTLGGGFLLGEEGLGFLGNVEVLVGGESETRAGGIHEFGAALAVALGGAFDFGNALGDDGFADDDLRPAVVFVLGAFEGFGDFLDMVAVDHHGVPVLGEEIGFGVLALGDVRHGVERHLVGVIDEDQVVEAVVAGEGDGLLGHTFLKAAVAVQCDDVVIDDRVIGGVE